MSLSQAVVSVVADTVVVSVWKQSTVHLLTSQLRAANVQMGKTPGTTTTTRTTVVQAELARQPQTQRRLVARILAKRGSGPAASFVCMRPQR